MARFPRNVRQPRAVAAFVKAGGVERRGKGSHRVVKMPNGNVLAVPAGILKVGLLKHLVKTADLSEDEFAELL
jgi:predicted RNA binding protein YcfA (HicA-like mRNA interferase family)